MSLMTSKLQQHNLSSKDLEGLPVRPFLLPPTCLPVYKYTGTSVSLCLYSYYQQNNNNKGNQGHGNCNHFYRIRNLDRSSSHRPDFQSLIKERTMSPNTNGSIFINDKHSGIGTTQTFDATVKVMLDNGWEVVKATNATARRIALLHHPRCPAMIIRWERDND